MATVVFTPTEELPEYTGWDHGDEKDADPQPVTAQIPTKWDEKKQEYVPTAKTVELEVSDRCAKHLTETFPSNFKSKG